MLTRIINKLTEWIQGELFEGTKKPISYLFSLGKLFWLTPTSI